METKSWKKIKDSVYGKKRTPRRDTLDRKFECFKAGLPMNDNEFNAFIKEGKKGPFLSSSEFKKKFDNWRIKLKK